MIKKLSKTWLFIILLGMIIMSGLLFFLRVEKASWETAFNYYDQYQETPRALSVAYDDQNKSYLIFKINDEQKEIIDQYSPQGQYLGYRLGEDAEKINGYLDNPFYVLVIESIDAISKKRKTLFKTTSYDANLLWQSKDLKSMYFASRSNTQPYTVIVGDVLTSHSLNDYIVFKSSDYAKTFFKLLNWPKHRTISNIFFFEDGIRGYILSNNRSIWKTIDAGENWQRINLPKSIKTLSQPMPIYNNKNLFSKAYFPEDFFYNAAYFDEKTGSLSIATFDHDPQALNTGMGAVYKLEWQDHQLDYTAQQSIFNLTGVYITHLIYDQHIGTVFTVIEDDFSSGSSDWDLATYVYHMNLEGLIYSRLLGKKLNLREFYKTDQGTLYLTGSEDVIDHPRFKEVSFISYDFAESWTKQTELYRGSMLSHQVDVSTGTAWIADHYDLNFRKIDK